ncbi:TetR/AcrR family transcriptional regulator [filamentous cyanobacterium LEGE 11480]|uniref:TetR/AcrR family transcriptional regulator n=1 Tax=Romeriopsis navalis LEGE 11480 TaxID=2777977 RepID=A0A928VL55_9CYAN|nr:TetR/AcrR family transcriptional regulator [Romeriopsis navalis]MBE9030613.1 TetR/AcrR family transcriptional regulator [Romeriopsis navalis LEGE 11480]
MQEYSATAIEILDAAERRMRSGGFDAVSYRYLADDVGMKAASVHYHFPQKALLGKAVVDRYAEKFLNTLGRIDHRQNSVEQHLQRLCDGYESAVRNTGLICLCCILGAESQDLPKIVSEAIANFFNQLIYWTQKALGDHPKATTLAPHLIGTLQGTMILAVTLKRPELMGEAANQLISLVNR